MALVPAPTAPPQAIIPIATVVESGQHNAAQTSIPLTSVAIVDKTNVEQSSTTAAPSNGAVFDLPSVPSGGNQQVQGGASVADISQRLAQLQEGDLETRLRKLRNMPAKTPTMDELNERFSILNGAATAPATSMNDLQARFAKLQGHSAGPTATELMDKGGGSVSDQMAQEFIDRLENDQLEQQQQQPNSGTPPQGAVTNVRQEPSVDPSLRIVNEMDAKVQALMKDDGAIKLAFGLDGGIEDSDIVAMMDRMKDENRLFGAESSGGVSGAEEAALSSADLDADSEEALIIQQIQDEVRLGIPDHSQSRKAGGGASKSESYNSGSDSDDRQPSDASDKDSCSD